MLSSFTFLWLTLAKCASWKKHCIDWNSQLQYGIKLYLNFLAKLEFHRLEQNHGVFVSEDKQLFIAIYVDNLLIFGADIPQLEKI